jgi:hypothetical protein
MRARGFSRRVWLYLEAKHNNDNKWLCCLLGFAFSLSGLFVYYLYKIATALLRQDKKIQITIG